MEAVEAPENYSSVHYMHDKPVERIIIFRIRLMTSKEETDHTAAFFYFPHYTVYLFFYFPDIA
jgi:hypothetical protein